MSQEEVKEVVREMIRDEVDRAFNQLTVKFADHFLRTERLLSMLEILGTPEDVRDRLAFVKLFIDREKDRVALRKAIIEKGLIGAAIAVAYFSGKAMWNALLDLISNGHVR